MKTRMRVFGIALGAFALLSTGCGNLTIRSWVKVITAQSSGSLTSAALGPPIPINRPQGGFLGTIGLDTTNILQPLDGTLAVEDVRIAGDTAPSIVGAVCIWGNPAVPSGGTLHLDIVGGSGSATITLNVKAQAKVGDTLGIPPSEISQVSTFPLGSGIGIAQLLAASQSGSSDGLFATSASFSGETVLVGLPAVFALNLAVTNESTPPKFDLDLLSYCGPKFAEQGKDIFYGINSKSTYLLTANNDAPAAPLVIKLSDIGATPGHRLKIARVGSYDDITELKDGDLTKLGAVFSSSATVNAASNRNRIPGAINAGSDVNTGSFLRCIIFPFCLFVPTDISQDFAVTNSPTVTIPSGAQYLIVGTIPDSLVWADNSGFGLGVSLTLDP